jgi:serine/threonine protein kinase
MGYIGGGAFGKVYKVKHKSSDEICVLKEVVIKDRSFSETHVKECLEEARFLMQNRHPHIIGIFLEFIQCDFVAKSLQKSGLKRYGQC